MKKKPVVDNFFLKLSSKFKTPLEVQDFLRRFHYNSEKDGETVKSAYTSCVRKKAHCLEAALVAAAILEKHGYPPLLMSLESKDLLDHVLFIFKEKTGWGAIGRSRFEGLHGREPRFKSVRTLALSYFDPFIDQTGKLTAYGVMSLDDSKTDWRFSERNLWKLENELIDLKHKKLKTSKRRYEKHFELFIKTGRALDKGKWWL